MNKQEERDEFLVELLEELHATPAREVFKLARELMRLANRHHRLQEAACNVTLTERQEKTEQRTEEKIRALCAPLGITPVFSGDPRGATVKLKVPSGRTNDWGGTGICVPH